MSRFNLPGSLTLPRLNLNKSMVQGLGLRKSSAHDLLPPALSHEVALHYVIGVLCFLACLTAVVVVASNRAAKGWTDDIRSEITVQVRPTGLETAPSAAARAAEVLSGVPGVDEVAAIEPEKAKALLKPWMGDVVLDDLPIPNLVEIRLSTRNPARPEALQRALDAAHIEGNVDDHRLWLKDIDQSALSLRLISALIFLVLASAAGAVVAFATRAGLISMAGVVEILSLVGTEDRLIAEGLQTRFARLAFESGMIGAAAAGVILIVLKATSRSQSFAIALPMDWPDLIFIVPCPFVAALIAGWTARTMSLRLLAKGI